MPLGVGLGQNVGLRDFCHILTLLPPGASVFHKHVLFFFLEFHLNAKMIHHDILPDTGEIFFSISASG